MTPMLSSALLRRQTDARLVALARQGHERAFEAIVVRYRRELVRACHGMLSEARAEDAVQQALMNAWTALQAGAQVDDLRAWLHRVARNAAIDIVRRSREDASELSDTLAATGTTEILVERRAALNRALSGVAALPERQRLALVATAIDGRRQDEVAREMGMTHGALRQLVHTARCNLRAAATALTPGPVASWAATTAGSPTPQRAIELAGGAGGAGLAGAALKTGVAIVLAGSVVVGAPRAILPLGHHARSSSAVHRQAPALGALAATARAVPAALAPGAPAPASATPTPTSTAPAGPLASALHAAAKHTSTAVAQIVSSVLTGGPAASAAPAPTASDRLPAAAAHAPAGVGLPATPAGDQVQRTGDGAQHQPVAGTGSGAGPGSMPGTTPTTHTHEHPGVGAPNTVPSAPHRPVTHHPPIAVSTEPGHHHRLPTGTGGGGAHHDPVPTSAGEGASTGWGAGGHAWGAQGSGPADPGSAGPGSTAPSGSGAIDPSAASGGPASGLGGYGRGWAARHGGSHSAGSHGAVPGDGPGPGSGPAYGSDQGSSTDPGH